MQHPEDILVAPLVSEESWRLQASNIYAFRVRPEATKQQIKRAVEELFKVRVVAVRTMNMPGKPRRQRFYQRGRTPRWKKAFVRLAEGHRIEMYQ
jgi:large subunit ribosomal protein L23